MSIDDISPVKEGISHGIPWRVLASPIAFTWNGYIRLPANHPWRILEDWRIPTDVHGGITYGPDWDGWVGFDTCHADDSTLMLDGTDMDADLRTFCDLMGIPAPESPHRWTCEEVVAETRRLAHQAADAMPAS